MASALTCIAIEPVDGTHVLRKRAAVAWAVKSPLRSWRSVLFQQPLGRPTARLSWQAPGPYAFQRQNREMYSNRAARAIPYRCRRKRQSFTVGNLQNEANFPHRFMACESVVAYYAASYPSRPSLEARNGRGMYLVDNQSTHSPPAILTALPSSSVTSMMRSGGVVTCLPEIRYQVVLSPGTRIRRIAGP
jgi:hypothetical protein